MATVAVVLTIALICIAWICKRKPSSSKTWPRDKVVLHQVTRGPRSPSLSPFCLKLETYLRLANIPYLNEFNAPMSAKGKRPWITYDGEDVADSQFCIEYLNRKFNVDLNSQLTQEQRAVARAFHTLVEDSLMWCFAVFRYRYDDGVRFSKSVEVGWECLRSVLGPLGVSFRRWKFLTFAWCQGMGRHSRAEILNITEANLKALSDFLGSKPYFMGDQPCEQDCTIFGLLAQTGLSKTPIEQLLEDKFHNLQDYTERMKSRCWPDWNDCTLKGMR